MDFGSCQNFLRFQPLWIVRVALYTGFSMGIYFMGNSLIYGLRFLSIGLAMLLSFADLMLLVYLAPKAKPPLKRRENIGWWVTLVSGLLLAIVTILIAAFLYSDSMAFHWLRQPIAKNVSVADLSQLDTYNIFFFVDGVVATSFAASSSVSTTEFAVVAPLTSNGAPPIFAWVVHYSSNTSAPASWSYPYRQAIRDFTGGDSDVQAAISKAKSQYLLNTSSSVDHTVVQWVNFTTSYRNTRNDARSILYAQVAVSVALGFAVPFLLTAAVFFCCCCCNIQTECVDEHKPLIQ